MGIGRVVGEGKQVVGVVSRLPSRKVRRRPSLHRRLGCRGRLGSHYLLEKAEWEQVRPTCSSVSQLERYSGRQTA